MKNYVAEFLGTAILLAIVTGSGLMGEMLGAGNAAVASSAIALQQVQAFTY
jgi:glycerol uptake facilitator-like aquaporin